MLTISGQRAVSVQPSGRVRNASTSNLLSFDMKVNGSTAASRLPGSSSAFTSVSRRPPTYSSAGADGVASVYAMTDFDTDTSPTVPVSPTIFSAGQLDVP